ncbi:hypothetical protein TSUD_254230 [Trifolium subterraneum]|uniref:Legume lectin domain-containing protein n=1 Tax=Trifolium subterraneum TaxID=3900 RepID=A0A2Z6NGX4_TRISU|nr:hypothetical protein TSUD_254230 [Trifolium subterraneum]
MALHGKNPFMAILLLIFFVSSSYASSSAHTTVFEFEYPSFQSRGVRMVGDTFINQTTFSVQLITDHSTIRPAVSSLHSYGTMVYPSPILFFHHGRRTNKACSFTTNFSFSISHTNYSFYGEGFSFFITPTSPSNASPAMFGLPNRQPFFAVAFDTKSIEYSSISININYLERSQERSPWKTVQIDEQFMDLQSGDRFYSWIEYDSSIDFLSVFLSKDIHHPSVPFIVVADLLYSFLRDHTFMDVGFSGLSIKKSEIYSIHSWNFTSKVENKLIKDKL